MPSRLEEVGDRRREPAAHVLGPRRTSDLFLLLLGEKRVVDQVGRGDERGGSGFFEVDERVEAPPGFEPGVEVLQT